ncbi:hypothetical protein cyc_03488 [Cyclospora cayetanensis]|uniref:Uncharacterized protein n=1 Tax=Cyclospora cayetanensis TaxID=88456 RepID=A0A1D3DB32_9EIME|nr:hypothetical protein cyc_03488 [Cyclospora cayetanensis]
MSQRLQLRMGQESLRADRESFTHESLRASEALKAKERQLQQREELLQRQQEQLKTDKQAVGTLQKITILRAGETAGKMKRPPFSADIQIAPKLSSASSDAPSAAAGGAPHRTPRAPGEVRGAAAGSSTAALTAKAASTITMQHRAGDPPSEAVADDTARKTRAAIIAPAARVPALIPPAAGAAATGSNSRPPFVHHSPFLDEGPLEELDAATGALLDSAPRVGAAAAARTAEAAAASPSSREMGIYNRTLPNSRFSTAASNSVERNTSGAGLSGVSSESARQQHQQDCGVGGLPERPVSAALGGPQSLPSSSRSFTRLSGVDNLLTLPQQASGVGSSGLSTVSSGLKRLALQQDGSSGRQQQPAAATSTALRPAAAVSLQQRLSVGSTTLVGFGAAAGGSSGAGLQEGRRQQRQQLQHSICREPPQLRSSPSSPQHQHQTPGCSHGAALGAAACLRPNSSRGSTGEGAGRASGHSVISHMSAFEFGDPKGGPLVGGALLRDGMPDEFAAANFEGLGTSGRPS